VNKMRQALVAASLSLLVLSQPAFGQLNPSRTITLVVTVAPGGGSDAMARLIAEQLQERLKQPVVVENRAGGGGTLGVSSVARAAPDGHTLLLLSTSASISKWLYKNVTFDVVADFSYVARAVTMPVLLFAHPAVPVRDARELIAYAKANPGKLSVGTPGVGSPHHLAAAMMNASAGIDLTHVPYRGTGPALNDLLGGQISMLWAAPPPVMPLVAEGKVKLLALASPQRLPDYPNVPTLSESGLPGFSVEIWQGIAAPARTPPEIVTRLENEISQILERPEVRQRLRPLGANPSYASSVEFRKLVSEDHLRFGKVIRDAGIAPNGM
jgi:tripartite-type tricarboxylate transporter receptor subunit TctC